MIEHKIYELRGLRVMLDFDLAELYEMPTKVLKQTVRRNIDRFPGDFMFELTFEEVKSLIDRTRSQFVTLNETYNERGANIKYSPFAFTQEGVAMLSRVLRSPVAVQVNINIMRAFVRMREYLLTRPEDREWKDLKKQIEYLQEDVKSLEKDHLGYEQHFEDIYLALAQLAQRSETKSRRLIGFKREEEKEEEQGS